MKKRGGARFAKALTKVVRDPRLTPAAKGLYACLKTYCDSNGHCFPAISTIARMMNSSRTSVLKWLGELLQMRIVHRTPRHFESKQTTSDYLFDDEHFAKHLAFEWGNKKCPYSGPLGVSNICTTEVDPCKKKTVSPKIVRFRQKPSTRRAADIPKGKSNGQH